MVNINIIKFRKVFILSLFIILINISNFIVMQFEEKPHLFDNSVKIYKPVKDISSSEVDSNIVRMKISTQTMDDDQIPKKCSFYANSPKEINEDNAYFEDIPLTQGQQNIKHNQIVSLCKSENYPEKYELDINATYQNSGLGLVSKECFAKERFGLSSEDIRNKYHESPTKFRKMLTEYKEYLRSYELEENEKLMTLDLNEKSNIIKEKLQLPILKRMLRNDEIEVYSEGKKK